MTAPKELEHMISLRKGVNTCIGAKSSAPTGRRITSGCQTAMDQNQGESLKNILGRPLYGGKKKIKKPLEEGGEYMFEKGINFSRQKCICFKFLVKV